MPSNAVANCAKARQVDEETLLNLTYETVAVNLPFTAD